MLLPEYKKMVSELLKLTESDLIKWEQSNDVSYQYYLNSPNDEQKILIDKYYGLENNGQKIPCVNITVFDINNKIINEMVLCNLADMKEDFELFENLYKAVENQFSKKIEPLFTQITESFQRQHTAH